MQATDVIEMLRARIPFNQRLADYVPRRPYPEDLIRELLDSNAEKIDGAIKKSVVEYKNIITLASWGDDGEIEGVLGKEIDALNVHDSERLRYGVSWRFSYRLQSVIRRWVLERYQFEADFYDASDGCNAAWVITIQKKSEIACC